MATRLYLPNGAAYDPGFTITPDAGWNQTAGTVLREMRKTAQTNAFTDDAQASAAAGNKRLCRQYISPEMAAGNAFTTGTSFTMQVLGLESAINDNIVNRVRCVKVVSADGQTVRATLIALSNAASVVEWNTTLRNLTFLNGLASVGYTTVSGDRILVEVGYQDSAGASISGTLRWGADVSGTGDLGLNETDTTTTLRPWFETSLNIVWSTSAVLQSRQKRMYHHLTR